MERFQARREAEA